MIRRLLLEEVVLVERLELELGPGLNALSGGSGEGKSLIVEALGFLCGGPGGARLVRRGADEARVTAWFEVIGRERRAALLEAGVVDRAWADGEALLELRRVVDRRGRSRGSANGAPLAAPELRRAGELLVEVFGQGEAARLAEEPRQLALLDACAGIGARVAEHGRARARALELARERDGLFAAERAAEAAGAREEEERTALLALAPEPGEWDALLEREGRVEAADRELQRVARAAAELVEDEEANLDRRLRAVLSDLSRIEAPGPRVAEAREALEGALAQVAAAGELLARERDAFQLDQVEAEQVRARIAAMRRVARQVGRAPEALAARAEELAARPDPAELARRRRELEQGLEAAFATLEDEAAEISGARGEARQRVERGLARTLPELGLPEARFLADLTTHGGDRPDAPRGVAAWSEVERAEPLLLARHPAPSGRERARFLFAAGPETEPAPLTSASGGELSRLFLALGREQSCRADGAGAAVPVLVFDEVDQNVGARLGAAVGDCLVGLARGRQVVLVTHLAPVAARADRHLRVIRSGGRSQAEPLEGEARIEELALMVRGAPVTEAARAQARELLREAEAGRARPPAPRGRSSQRRRKGAARRRRAVQPAR